MPDEEESKLRPAADWEAPVRELLCRGELALRMVGWIVPDEAAPDAPWTTVAPPPMWGRPTGLAPLRMGTLGCWPCCRGEEARRTNEDSKPDCWVRTVGLLGRVLVRWAGEAGRMPLEL